MANNIRVNIRPRQINQSGPRDIYLSDHGILCIDGSIEEWAHALNANLYNWSIFKQGTSWHPVNRYQKRLEILEFIEKHCKNIKEVIPKHNRPMLFKDDGTVDEELLRLSIESEGWFLELEEKNG